MSFCLKYTEKHIIKSWKSFKFQPYVRKGCHDTLIMQYFYFKCIPGVDYGCIIDRTDKSKAKNALQKIDLTEKREKL